MISLYIPIKGEGGVALPIAQKVIFEEKKHI